ncbi:hypothetical protein HDK64DRAFT_272732 [Phyllosticta capitalensis]
MPRIRYYAALNDVRARRLEYRREDSSESLDSVITTQLEMMMVLPAIADRPTRPSQQRMSISTNCSTIVNTEMEPTQLPGQSFLVPALHQVSNDASSEGSTLIDDQDSGDNTERASVYSDDWCNLSDGPVPASAYIRQSAPTERELNLPKTMASWAGTGADVLSQIPSAPA